jgi:hypothetical protein
MNCATWRWMLAATLAIGAAEICSPASVADGLKATADGVQALVLREKFQGDLGILEKEVWTLADDIPWKLHRGALLVAKNEVVSLNAESGHITIYTRHEKRLTKRAEAAFGAAKPLTTCKLVRRQGPARLGVEFYAAGNAPEFALLLSADGILEFAPGHQRQLALDGLRLRYGIVPSLIGTDFVYETNTRPVLDRLHFPSLNMFVGLVEGEECMAVGVWPRGEQAAAFRVGRSSGPAILDGLDFDTAGQSCYLSFIERPPLPGDRPYSSIWHAEPLKPAYLEKNTVIAWQRPFEAQWIGRFFIASEEMSWPFYFRYQPAKVWGRYIRGWFGYPLWFDGPKTLIHFEKHFPPTGELLLYYLESPEPGKRGQAPFAGTALRVLCTKGACPLFPAGKPVNSPVSIMSKALGEAETARLLDFDGTVEKTLLAHRLAVCAMTNTMQNWFNAGKEAQERAQIERWCDDTFSFIRMIRARTQEFGDLARRMKRLLAERAKAEPKLAAAVAELDQMLTAIEQSAKNDLPNVPLATVRQWTDAMKAMAAQVQPGNAKKYEKLAGQCRSVAGGQDDLARALSIQAIRLTEEAARQGVQSAAHAKLAQEVIVMTRQVLRKPTWWEPNRCYVPKSDPGRP